MAFVMKEWSKPCAGRPLKSIADLDKKYGKPDLKVASFNPDQIREEVEKAKRAGLIRAPGYARPIEKSGAVAVELGGVKSQWMDITPGQARLWLENNFRNRPVDDDTVAAYARDMTNGVWVPTHQGVAFNDRDELIDGQHRLRAIVKCGKTIRMMVTFGLSSSIEGKEMTTMDAVDRGRTRSVADQLKIQHGMKDGSIIASVAGLIGSVCYGKRTRRLSVGQTLEIYREFEGAIKWVIVHRVKGHGLRSAGVLAGFAFALATQGEFWARYDTCEIQKMHEGLLNGTGFEAGSPIALLREFLTSDDAKLLLQGTNRGMTELVLQAIWLQMKKAKIEKLELGEDGVNHFKKLQSDRVAKIAAMFILPEESKNA